MVRRGRLALAVVMAVALFGCGFLLLRYGVYGWTLFLVVPVLVGALSSWVVAAGTASAAAWAGMTGAAISTCAFLAFGLEGLVCITMTLPLAVPLGALGGWLAFRAAPRRLGAGSAAMMCLLPVGTMVWDTSATPALYEVRSTLEIAAPPEQVWNHVVTFAELPAPREWFFRTGLAYPIRARMEGRGAGAVRYCEFSTGAFVEPIEVWDAPRRLAFRVTHNPPPLEEWSPYGRIAPRHLHGYFQSERGQFRLVRIAGGRTLLEGTTWYRHGLWPGEYWRWWSDAVIHRIHLRVLEGIRAAAEVRR